jgi:hypothetical protein
MGKKPTRTSSRLVIGIIKKAACRSTPTTIADLPSELLSKILELCAPYGWGWDSDQVTWRHVKQTCKSWRQNQNENIALRKLAESKELDKALPVDPSINPARWGLLLD